MKPLTLSDDRREALAGHLRRLFAEEFDEDLSGFPMSGQEHFPEGFVIFDDVFVPNDRVFLDGETGSAAVFAHSLGLWERLGGLSSSPSVEILAKFGRKARTQFTLIFFTIKRDL